MKIQVNIRDVCVLFALLEYYCHFHLLIHKNCYNDDQLAGLLAAAFIAITPGYISESIAGSYDNKLSHHTINVHILVDQSYENWFVSPGCSAAGPHAFTWFSA